MGDILGEISRIVEDLCRSACSQIEQEYSSLPDDYGEGSVRMAEKAVAKDCIARSICAMGQKAWIAEYGRGSKMVTSLQENPFLADYITGRIKDEDGNPLFNPARLQQSLSIIGRPYGYYYDLDGKRYHSTGGLAGKVIEDNSSGNYEAISPRFIIRNILFNKGGIVDEMCEAIQKVLMTELRNTLKLFPKEIVIYDK